MNPISTEKIVQPVPEPTVRRMPTYLNYLRDLAKRQEQFITAPTIGRVLHLDPTQVVKDMAFTGVSGRPRVGYLVTELVAALEDFLGYNRTHEAFLVGAGFLGSALIQYQGFRESGLRIVAAFDIDKKKVGIDIAGVPVFHFEKFRDLANRLHISIGIITAPAPAAQQVADLMVGWGIRAIWNFAPVPLVVPDHIIVQDTHIYANLAVILNKLKNINDI